MTENIIEKDNFVKIWLKNQIRLLANIILKFYNGLSKIGSQMAKISAFYKDFRE
jgi:hypothetical protein